MGRGAQATHQQTASRSTIAGGEDPGEIPLLDADRLDDHRGAQAKSGTSGGTGDPNDDRAIKKLASKLRGTSVGAKAGDEELQDMAIDLYNRLCRPIREGTADQEHLAKTSSMLGESVDQLRGRLEEREREPASVNAKSLLNAIKSQQ